MSIVQRAVKCDTWKGHSTMNLKKDWQRWILLVPVIVFFAFSWQKSFTGDEGLTVYLASGSYNHLLTNVGSDFHVPGYYTALWLVSHIFGNSILVLRLFSLLIVLTLITVASKHLPFPAALFVALSPFSLHLAVEIRMYSMLALLGLLLILSYRKYVRLQSRISLFFLIAVLSACTWVHYFGWIGTAAVVSVLLLKKRWKQSALVFLTVFILFLPWGGNVISKINPQNSQSVASVEDLPDEPSLVQRIMGMPFSVAGTTLRFAGGTSVFNFNTWGIRSFSISTIAGFLLGLLMLILAAAGFKNTDSIVRSLILWAFLALSFFRPSARHYAIAFPAYMLAASSGLPKINIKRRYFIVFIALFMLLLSVPFAKRSTIPQRCIWDRDFLQLATLTIQEAEKEGIPVVLFLDTYSYLGIRMHMNQIEYPDSLIWYPHRESFENGICFFDNRAECLAYLQHNTDSLVSHWMSLSENNRGFVLIANNPEKTTGPIMGSDRNTFIGLGSDIMADSDLMDVLESKMTVRDIPLSLSNGPLSLFVCTPKVVIRPPL